MLSRFARLSNQHQTINAVVPKILAASSSSVSNPSDNQNSLYIRPVRREFPAKVRLGFVPDDWFTFFYKKTGVTGPYAFVFTLSTYLVSKEIYVLEHEFYTGLSIVVLWTALIKKFGPAVAKWLDKEVDAYEEDWNASRKEEKEHLEASIKNEEHLQWSTEGQNMLVQAKRENVDLQLEAAYRERLSAVYTAIKQRLDYQMEKRNVEQRIAHKNLVDWVVKSVRGAITPDQDKQNIDKCIADLVVLSKK